MLYINKKPDSNLSLKKTPRSIISYFAQVKHYIVVTIDAYGSGRQGWRLRSPIWQKIGSIEAHDQLKILKYLYFYIQSYNTDDLIIKF